MKVPVQVPVTVMTTQARQVPRQVAVTNRVMVPVQVPAAACARRFAPDFTAELIDQAVEAKSMPSPGGTEMRNIDDRHSLSVLLKDVQEGRSFFFSITNPAIATHSARHAGTGLGGGQARMPASRVRASRQNVCLTQKCSAKKDPGLGATGVHIGLGVIERKRIRSS